MLNVFRLFYVRSDEPGRKHQVGYFAEQTGVDRAVIQFIARLKAVNGVAVVHNLEKNHYRVVHPDGDKFIDLLIETISVVQSEELKGATS